MQSKFQTVPDKPNFPDEEEKVLQFWEEINAFHKQLELSEGKPEFTFYDGPPFATGLPHYGHIAAGTIKDVVTRYATMKGHYVKRRFGWDCHGLPIEFEIDKQYGIKDSKQREQLGVKKYNELCRGIVQRYAKEWRHIISRFGRWIDFDDDYKTMDPQFMESIWYTFSEMYKKGLVYKSLKIMPYSTGCNTPLSNSEAGSNYKEVSDPAIIITFPIIGDKDGTCLIAWTTTPWTLPSNLAAAVNPKMDYCKWVNEETGKIYISMKDRLQYTHKQAKVKKHKILETFKGKDLVGLKYEPLFKFFEDKYRPKGCFSVIGADFVTTSAGTGVVHCAPGFGEDDFQACVGQKIIKPSEAPVPIDQDGRFTSEISTYEGIYIKDADKTIIKDLKDAGRLFSHAAEKHSYPFCWRSQTPLVYRGEECWFVEVTKIKERLLELNTTNKWVPEFVQTKRFHNWLADARDWCISRTRYWGNPIPLWVSDDGEEIVCVSSIAELQKLSGRTDITDIHKEYVDEIEIPSKQGKGMLKRIPDVFDCWFESGSMPYAQCNYPYGTKEEEFMKGFPADFIAEGLDQTRGWFYTLMVISCAVKDAAPFKNLIVNGIVLAEDGTKMSKSKKNYPDPMWIAKAHGADACRLYLCNSPLVRAEPLKFSGEGVKSIVRDIFLPWFNSYRFCVQNITRWEKRVGKNFVYDPKLKEKVFKNKNANIMDRWIIAASQRMIQQVRYEMDNYHLYGVLRHILSFLENLTNWYVRLNRPRMKGNDTKQEDQFLSLNILFEVLLSTTQLISPVTPFLSEHIYQNLKNGLKDGSPEKAQSIHFTSIPEYSDALIDEKTEENVERMQNAIETGRFVRDQVNVSMKYPLPTVKLIDADQEVLDGFKTLERYIKEELNCVNVEYETNEDKFIQYTVVPDNRACGQAFGKKFNALKPELTKLTNDQIKKYIKNGKIKVGEFQLTEDMLKVQKQFRDTVAKDTEWGQQTSDKGANVMLGIKMSPELLSLGQSREVTNRIQRLRKTSGISIDDQIEIFYEFTGKASSSSQLGLVMNEHTDKIIEQTKMPVAPISEMTNPLQRLVGVTEYVCQEAVYKPSDNAFTWKDMPEEVVKLHIYLAGPKFDDAKLTADFGSKGETFVNDLKMYLSQFSAQALQSTVESNKGVLEVVLDGHKVALRRGDHFHLNLKDKQA